jgi:hypothetical protein
MIAAPPIGTPVLYFPFAESDKEPCPAIVTEVNKLGVCRLSLFLKNGDVSARHAVYHINSKDIRTERGELKEGARRTGAWDYHPWFHPPVDCDSADPEFPLADNDGDEEPDTTDYGRSSLNEEKERKVLEYINDGDFETVFKKAKFLGISRSDLESIFQKHGKMALAPTSP